MIVTELKDFKSNKVKVSLDNGIAFVLYKGDLSKYKIYMDAEIDEKTLESITGELLPKRAMARALKLITGRDITENDLRNKLKADMYSDEVIDTVLDKLKDENLINDDRFVRGFIESKSSKKSKRDIIIALSSKGINSDFAESIYNELYESGELSDEKELIHKLLEKRHFDPENISYEDAQKEVKYLLNKGFSFDSIRSVMKNF